MHTETPSKSGTGAENGLARTSRPKRRPHEANSKGTRVRRLEPWARDPPGARGRKANPLGCRGRPDLVLTQDRDQPEPGNPGKLPSATDYRGGRGAHPSLRHPWAGGAEVSARQVPPQKRLTRRSVGGRVAPGNPPTLGRALIQARPLPGPFSRTPPGGLEEVPGGPDKGPGVRVHVLVVAWRVGGGPRVARRPSPP